MKNFLRLPLLVCLSTLSARALDPNDVIMRGQGLNQIDVQSGWDISFNDFPDGGHTYTYGAGNFSASGTIVLTNAITGLAHTLPAGTWKVFIKCLDYDYASSFSATIAGATSDTAVMNDRDDTDASNRWQGPVTITTGSSSTTVRLDFTRAPATSDSAHLQLVALYITPASNPVWVKTSDQIQRLDYPTGADDDNGTPVKGNMLGNGSFESGYGFGWGWFLSDGRTWNIGSTWDTNVAHGGVASMRFDAFNGAENSAIWLVSRPIKIRANATNTISMWIKTTNSTAGLILRLINSGTVPNVAFPAAPTFATAETTANTSWQRVSLTARLPDYPNDSYHIVIEKRGSIKGGPATFVDEIQLEEGALTSYAPKYGLTYGILSSVPGHIFYTNDTLEATMRSFNATAANTNLSVFMEVYDLNNQLVTNRTIAVSVNAGSTVSQQISLGTGGRMGAFRAVLYGENRAQEEEWTYSIVPPPLVSGVDPLGILGTHPDTQDYALDIMVRSGAKWVRGLSPMAHWRWNIAEPDSGGTRGANVYYDAEVARITAHGLTVLANVGENTPTWAKRQYYTLSGKTGTFTAGETVTAPGGYSAKVAAIIPSSSFVGDALQVTNNSGNLASGVLVTGSSSGATGTTSMTPFAAAPDLDAWTNYIANMVGHYDGLGVKHWEIWNEPNQDVSEIPGSAANPKTSLFYTEMLRRAITTITNIDSTARIVALGGVIDVTYATNIIFRLTSAERAYIEAAAVHLYPQPNDSTTMAGFVATISQSYPTISMWNTEAGYREHGYYSGINANLPLDSEYVTGWQTQLRMILGHARAPLGMLYAMFRSLGGGGGKIFYYDDRPGAGQNIQTSSYTALDYDDQLKPKQTVMAIANGILGHGAGMGKIANSSTNLEAFAWTNNATGIATVWSPYYALETLNLSGQLTSSQYKVLNWLGNPKTTNGLTVEISRYPVYIIGNGITADALKSAIAAASVAARTDTVAPVVSIPAGPEGKLRFASTARFRAFAEDEKDLPEDKYPDVIKYSYRIIGNDENWTVFNPSAAIAFTPSTSGVFRLDLRAQDLALNTSSVVSRDFTVLNADGSDPAGGPGEPMNSEPVLTTIGSRTIDELSLLSIALTATDVDAGQTLTYSLTSGPTGSAVTSSGGTGVKSNLTAMTIPLGGASSLYPSPITVSGLSGLITSVSVTLTNLSHEFPDDIDILLVGPTGARTMLMSDTGGGTDMVNVTLTFSDAAGSSLPDSSAITAGTYKPTDFESTENMTSPAPSTPYMTNLTTFVGTDANGTWNLYVRDEDGSGDQGSLAGWYLTIVAGGNTFTWTPTDAQGPGVYSATIRVTDNGSPTANDTETITLTVNEVNIAPVMTQPADVTGQSTTDINFNLAATDADLPAQTLTFSMDSGPSGATIGSTGHFSWVPLTSQAGTNAVVARVSDGATPIVGTHTRTFSVIVTNTGGAGGGGGGGGGGPGTATYWVTSVGTTAALDSGVVTGTGTFADPLAGDFDKILDNTLPNDTIMLKDEGFYDFRAVTLLGSISNIADGVDIIGLNTNCVLRIVVGGVEPQQVTGLLSRPDNIGSMFHNFTLDCGAAINTSTAYAYKRNGIFLFGSGNVVSNVIVARPYGRDAAGNVKEAFALHLLYGQDNIVRDCKVIDVKGNYVTLFGFGGGVIERCEAVGNADFVTVAEKIHGFNLGGGTNVIARNLLARNVTDGLYYDEGVSLAQTIQDSTFTNLVSGGFVNLYTPTNDLPIRGLQNVIFQRNKVYWSPIPTEVYGFGAFIISTPIAHACGKVDQNYIQNVDILGNYFGYGTGVTLPTLGAGKKIAVMMASDVPYVPGSPPLGINDVTIQGNTLQVQQSGPEAIVYVNQTNACVNPSALNFNVLPDAPIDPPRPTAPPIPLYVVPIYRPYTPFQVTVLR